MLTITACQFFVLDRFTLFPETPKGITLFPI